MLTWAMNRGGVGLPDFKTLPVERWMTGERQPTVKQLQDFARKVHVPYGFLFLPEPPQEEQPIPFFRSIGAEREGISINVRDTIQQMQQRQDWLSSYLRRENYDSLPFVGAFNQHHGKDAIIASIQKSLGLTENWANECPNWEEALKFLTQKIEDRRIIVVFNGVVGNNTHRPLDVHECRGFVLVNEMAPLLFVNNKDAKSAQLFTIVHELAHIWLGESAGFDFRGMLPADDPVEKLCDSIAAEFLVSEVSLREAWEQTHSIKTLSRKFKVSPIVIGRRLMDIGLYSRDQFFTFYNNYMRDFEDRNNTPESGGGNFYATARMRISPTFARYINQAVKTGNLLYRDAYRLTGLKSKTFERFMQDYL